MSPSSHDPKGHRGYVQQCLSQDKAPVGFFLSAGCPMSVRVPGEQGSGPLIPDIRGITELVTKALVADPQTSAKYAALVASFESDSDPTVEDLLSRVRALHAVVGSKAIYELSRDDLERLEKEITGLVAGVTSAELPQGPTPYLQLAAWAGAVPRGVPLEIFTTNYDLLMEQALERVNVPYFDGFVGAHRPFFDVAAIEQDEIPRRWVRLWKLHGSINWRQDESKGPDEAKGPVTRVSGQADTGAVLIHPSHLKYEQSRRMPYLAMIDRLRAFFRKPGAALVVCGYSFGDEHLNEVIHEGLQGNPTAVVFGLQYGPLDEYPEAIRLAENRSNLSLLANDEAVVGGTRAAWGSLAPDAGGAGAAFDLGDFGAVGRLLSEMVGGIGPERVNAG